MYDDGRRPPLALAGGGGGPRDDGDGTPPEPTEAPREGGAPLFRDGAPPGPGAGPTEEEVEPIKAAVVAVAVEEGGEYKLFNRLVNSERPAMIAPLGVGALEVFGAPAEVGGLFEAFGAAVDTVFDVPAPDGLGTDSTSLSSEPESPPISNDSMSPAILRIDY